MPIPRTKISYDVSTPQIPAPQDAKQFQQVLKNWSKSCLPTADIDEAQWRMAHCEKYEQTELNLWGLDMPAPPDLRGLGKLKTIKLDAEQFASWGATLSLPTLCRIDHGQGWQHLGGRYPTGSTVNFQPSPIRQSSALNVELMEARQSATTMESVTAAPAPSPADASRRPFLGVLLDWEKTGGTAADPRIARDRLYDCFIDGRATLDVKNLDIPALPDLSHCSALQEIALDWKQARQWGRQLRLPLGCKIAVGDMRINEINKIAVPQAVEPQPTPAVTFPRNARNFFPNPIAREKVPAPEIFNENEIDNISQSEVPGIATDNDKNVLPSPFFGQQNTSAYAARQAAPASASAVTNPHPIPTSISEAQNPQAAKAAGNPPFHSRGNHPDLLSYSKNTQSERANVGQASAEANTVNTQPPIPARHPILSRLPRTLYDPAPPPGTAERHAWRSEKLERAAFRKARKEKTHFFDKNPALITYGHGTVVDELKGIDARSYVRKNGSIVDWTTESVRQVGKHVLRKFVPKSDPTVTVAPYESRFGVPTRAYGSAALDMKSVEAHQHREFFEQELSQAQNGGWWRATWLSALMDRNFLGKPDNIHAAIIAALGEEATALADKVRQLAQSIYPPHPDIPGQVRQQQAEWRKQRAALKAEGKKSDAPLRGWLRLETILTKEHAGARFKLEGHPDIEATLVELTKRLLINAGEDPTEVKDLFEKRGMGEDDQILAILSQLGANGIIYHQPRVNPNAPKPKDPRADWTCSLSVPAEVVADDNDASPNPFRFENRTNHFRNIAESSYQFINTDESKAVILHRGAHFNLLFGNGLGQPPVSPDLS